MSGWDLYRESNPTPDACGYCGYVHSDLAPCGPISADPKGTR